MRRIGRAWRCFPLASIATSSSGGEGAFAIRTPSRIRASFLVALSATALLASSPAFATDFMVNSDSGPNGLRTALMNAVAGDTITFTGNISETSDLPAITKSITINGNGFTLSGAKSTGQGTSGLFVFSGTVAIENLTISQVTAQGGAGGNAGGGGAGLGGALFVASGANVTVTNVALLNNVARGGNGGSVPAAGGGGGGGVGRNFERSNDVRSQCSGITFAGLAAPGTVAAGGGAK